MSYRETIQCYRSTTTTTNDEGHVTVHEHHVHEVGTPHQLVRTNKDTGEVTVYER